MKNMTSRDYKWRAPVGWPGNISRKDNLATEAHRCAEPKPVAYGLGVAIGERGDIMELPVGATTADVFGFIVAPEFSTFTPNPEAGVMCDVMRQGYMTVKVASGDVTSNGVVYVRVNNPTDDHPLGEILAEEIAGETVAVPKARFVGPSAPSPDGSSVAEIAVNL